MDLVAGSTVHSQRFRSVNGKRRTAASDPLIVSVLHTSCGCRFQIPGTRCQALPYVSDTSFGAGCNSRPAVTAREPHYGADPVEIRSRR